MVKWIKKFWNKLKWWGRAAIIFFIVAIASGLIYVKTSAIYLLSPGDLSGMEVEQIELGGVKSHAELKSDCKHCHAPIHCVKDTRCQDCHFEIEQDRRDSSTLHGRLPGVAKCQTCHPEHMGHDADLTVFAFPNVDHYAMTGFSIQNHITNTDGKKFTCTTCHTKVREIIETIDCVQCHSAENHDEMAAHIETYGYGCFECHDGQDRMVAGFDHEPYFSLQGGHADLACSDCHQEKKYVGMGNDCADCHEEPEMHAGVFGDSCEYCHSEQGWSPAVLTRHTFEFQHGDEAVEDCETCHAGNYTEYPCAGCHEDQDMVVAHEPHGVVELSNCLECHPTGRGKAKMPNIQVLEKQQSGKNEAESSEENPESTPSTPWKNFEFFQSQFQYQYQSTPANKP